MSPQISLGRRTLREWSLACIALTGIALALIILIYSFRGWAPPWLRGAVGLHMQGGAGHAQGPESDAQRYVGSIILSPQRGDKCLERKLDNRNGMMWDKGYVDCDVIPPLKTLESQARGLAARRLKAIGKAFGPKDDE